MNGAPCVKYKQTETVVSTGCGQMQWCERQANGGMRGARNRTGHERARGTHARRAQGKVPTRDPVHLNAPPAPAAAPCQRADPLSAPRAPGPDSNPPGLQTSLPLIQIVSLKRVRNSFVPLGLSIVSFFVLFLTCIALCCYYFFSHVGNVFVFFIPIFKAPPHG